MYNNQRKWHFNFIDFIIFIDQQTCFSACVNWSRSCLTSSSEEPPPCVYRWVTYSVLSTTKLCNQQQVWGSQDISIHNFHGLSFLYNTANHVLTYHLHDTLFTAALTTLGKTNNVFQAQKHLLVSRCCILTSETLQFFSKPLAFILTVFKSTRTFHTSCQSAFHDNNSDF